jgi:hypothetical protein
MQQLAARKASAYDESVKLFCHVPCGAIGLAICRAVGGAIGVVANVTSERHGEAYLLSTMFKVRRRQQVERRRSEEIRSGRSKVK